MLARWVMVLGAAALLSGCAVPEARLRSGLIRAGLPRSLSACMAERIADLPKANGAESVDQFLHRVRALGDTEILGVTTSSAALCATGLAG